MMIYTTIYTKLYRLIPTLDTLAESTKLKADGFMDLNVDILHRDQEKTVIALSHYYRHSSGDMIADPDMEVRILHQQHMAEALTYQDSFGYRVVYPTEGKVAPRAKKDLNRFLNQWLTNLLNQGHTLKS